MLYDQKEVKKTKEETKHRKKKETKRSNYYLDHQLQTSKQKIQKFIAL